MAKASHKILRQVMQLTYGDADSAFRLQDRIGALHRNKLHQVIERVMEEFEVPGEVIRISSLELDLGSMEDIDLELLLPLALERALRDELGQLMVRKQYDPLVEVETLTVSEGKVEDWLYYLENGIKRWHESSQEVSISKLLKDLAPQGRDKLRQRLVVLLQRKNALERLLHETPTEDLDELIFLLLGEKTAREVLEWTVAVNAGILSQNEGFLSHFTSKLRQNSSKIAQKNVAIAQKYLKTALFRSWAQRGFSPSFANQVKAETLAKAQSQLHVALEVPVAEFGGADKDRSGVSIGEMLEYVLCYGCWPLGYMGIEKSLTIGEFIISEIKKQPDYVSSTIVKLLQYSSVRKRLVYQLSIIQFKEVLKALAADAEGVYNKHLEWVETLPTEVRNVLKSAPALRSGQLAVLGAMATHKTAKIAVAKYKEVLLVGSVKFLSNNEIYHLELLLSSDKQPDAEQQISKQVIQLYRELKPNEGAEIGEEEKNLDDAVAENPARTRPIVPKSLLQEALRQIPEDVLLSKGTDSKERNEDKKSLQNADNQQDTSIDETNETLGPAPPKTLLDALLYYVNYGVWPEASLDETEPNVNGYIVDPATVLTDLLQDKPTELAIRLFPMLAAPRVRERLAFQLEDKTFKNLVAAYVSVHSPVNRLQVFYNELQPLAEAIANILKTNDGAVFRYFPATLRAFVLQAMYEEPNMVDFQSFTKLFLEYYLENSQILPSELEELVSIQWPNVSVSESVKNDFVSAITYWKKYAESVGTVSASQEHVNDNNEILLAALEDVSQSGDSQLIDLDESYDSKSPFDSTITTEDSISPNRSPEAKKVDENIDAARVSGDTGFAEPVPDTVNELNKIVLPTSTEVVDKQHFSDVGSIVEPDAGKISDIGSKEGIDKQQVNEGEVADKTTTASSVSQADIPNKDITPKQQDNTVDNIDNQLVDSKFYQTESGAENTTATVNPDVSYPLSEAATLPFVDSQSIMDQGDAKEDANPLARQTLKQKIDAILQGQMPEKARQAKVVRPQNPFEREQPVAPLEDPVFIENAGVVLLWPFVGRCFATLGYTEKGLFKDMDMATRAIHLLQYMATGEEQAPEHLLVLNKVLCGIPVFEAIERDIVLNANEKEEADTLLKATIGNWDKMSKISVEALRDSFLKRGGRLTENEVSWTLRVDQASYDMLLDTLPWTIGMIKLKCMEKVLYVEWR